MKKLYVAKKFVKKSLALIETIEAVMTRYEAMGLDLSLRQLYYQLVSRNVIENSERSYKNIGSLVNDARLAGLLDWDMIKDRGRECDQVTTWEDPAEILRASAQWFRRDLWKTQPVHVEVMVEKQALEGVLLPVCRRLGVPFTANKGYSSVSAFYEAAQRIIRNAVDRPLDDNESEPKKVRIIYLGDHDPSGIDMTRDVKERLELLVGVGDHATRPENEDGDSDYEGSFFEDLDFEVERVALNMDQIREYNPPPNPAKMDDSRAEGYVRKYGRSSWELDALDPAVLASLVEEAVREHLDQELWDAAEAEQESMKVGLANLSRAWGKGELTQYLPTDAE